MATFFGDNLLSSSWTRQQTNKQTEDPAAFVVVQSTARVGIPRILRKLKQGLEEEGEEEEEEEGDDYGGGGGGGEEDSIVRVAPGTPSSLRRRIVHQMESLLLLSS